MVVGKAVTVIDDTVTVQILELNVTRTGDEVTAGNTSLGSIVFTCSELVNLTIFVGICYKLTGFTALEVVPLEQTVYAVSPDLAVGLALIPSVDTLGIGIVLGNLGLCVCDSCGCVDVKTIVEAMAPVNGELPAVCTESTVVS